MNSIMLGLSTRVDNRTWYLYSVEFKSDDKTYGCYIYALSREHASYIVEDLKATGKLADGELIANIPKGDLFTHPKTNAFYRLIGTSNGAGTSRGSTLMVYVDTETNVMYHRTVDDFKAKMLEV